MKTKILITDDDYALMKAYKNKFESEGFEVLSAQNGNEGLEIALKEHPDIILLDVIMPEMDGLSMLKKLRKDDWGKDVLVILLTNLDDTRKVFEAMKEGTYDYLVKSEWKLDDIVKKVNEKIGL